MRKTWATLPPAEPAGPSAEPPAEPVAGTDLHLDLGSGRGHAALERALREAVQDGRLAPGTRLPSSRALARDLGVARNTVVDAYGQLVAEGWLTALTGSGTRVAERPAETASPTVAAPAAARTPRFDLRPGHPDPSSFPRAAWVAATRRALRDAPVDAFAYGDPRGRIELREALAGYLGRARGVRADPDRIVVCSGFTQALTLLSDVLVARGATSIAVESHGHQFHRELIAGRGLALFTIPVDASGAVVGELTEQAAVVLTPAHQFPLGVALAASRRTAAVRWSGATGGLIVEDDYDGEFRYDRQAVGAMQALAPAHVVYAGTASKTLAPGVRLGWLVLPDDLVDEMVAAKAGADRHSATTDQLALAALIGSGGYDRHVRRVRLLYRRRRDRLVAMLREKAPAVRVTGLAAGMHAVLELPPGWDEREVVALANGHGLAIQGLGSFGVRRGPCLVIGYGTPPAHAFSAAIARLGATLESAHH